MFLQVKCYEHTKRKFERFVWNTIDSNSDQSSDDDDDNQVEENDKENDVQEYSKFL